MNVIDKIQALSNRLNTIVYESIKEAFEANERFVLDQQRAQLKRGEYKEKLPIRPVYTSIYKNLKNKSSFTPNLLDTGTFYQSIKLLVHETYAEITTEDPKAKYLFKRYEANGNNLFGLQDESLDNFIQEFVNPILKEKLNEFIKS